MEPIDYIIPGALSIAVFYVMTVYNRLSQLRNQVMHCWRQVSGQLSHRHDLVADLVAAIDDQVADDERDTLQDVIQARKHAVESMARGPIVIEPAERELNVALDRVSSLLQQSGDLQDLPEVPSLMQALSITEDRAATARQYYNAAVGAKNAAINSIPTIAIARLLLFRPDPLFDFEPRDSGAAEA